MEPSAENATSAASRQTGRLVALGVCLAFALLVTAWVFLIKAAREAKVESVPLATKGGRP